MSIASSLKLFVTEIVMRCVQLEYESRTGKCRKVRAPIFIVLVGLNALAVATGVSLLALSLHAEEVVRIAGMGLGAMFLGAEVVVGVIPAGIYLGRSRERLSRRKRLLLGCLVVTAVILGSITIPLSYLRRS